MIGSAHSVRSLCVEDNLAICQHACSLQAAGLLLRHWLASAEKGKFLLGIHPVSGRVAEQGHAAVAVASLKALQAFAKVPLVGCKS